MIKKDKEHKKALKEALKNEVNPLLIGLRNEIKNTNAKLEELKTIRSADFHINIADEILKQYKGVDGHNPIFGIDFLKPSEMKQIKLDLTPIAGKDFFTEKEKKAWLKKVTPRKGIDYKDGKTPIRGTDYFTVKDIKEFLAKARPIKGIDYKDGEPGAPGGPGADGRKIAPEEVRDKLESLKGPARLSMSAIKGLEEALKALTGKEKGGSTFSGGNNPTASGGGVTGSSDDSLTISGTDAIINHAHGNDYSTAQTFRGDVLASYTIGLVTGTPTATLDYSIGGNWIAGGYINAIRVTAYKDVTNVGRVYGSTYTASNPPLITDDNSARDIVFNWTWNAVAGATGYIVQRYNTGPNPVGGPSPMAFDYYVDVGGATGYTDYGDEWTPFDLVTMNSTLASYEVAEYVYGPLAFASNRMSNQSEFLAILATIGSTGDTQKTLYYAGGYLHFDNADGTRATIRADISASNVQASSIQATTFLGGTYSGNFSVGGNKKVVVTNASGVATTSGVDFYHYTGAVGTMLAIGGKTSFTTGDDTSRLWLNLATGSSVTMMFSNSTTGNTYLSGTLMGIDVNGGFFISNRYATNPVINLQNRVNFTPGSTTITPYVLTSGALNTSPVIGAQEFLTDKFYATITTGSARKEFALNDAALSSGLAVVTTTNGRLSTSATTDTQIGYLSTTTSDIQVQITAKAKRAIHFFVQNAKLPTSNPARIDAGDQNWRLLFDPATSQSGIWQFVMPQDYASVIGCSIRLLFTMNTTQSGTNAVIWRTYLMADTPGDAEDINSSGFGSANSGTSTLLNNQTAGYVRSILIAQTNDDSLSAGDIVQLKIDRDAANGSDTATGDAELVGILLEYTSS